MGCQQYFQEMLRIIDQIQQTQGEDIRLAADIIAESKSYPWDGVILCQPRRDRRPPAGRCCLPFLAPER